ncbi:hypothetical protein ACP70R_044998 [Stipagrostis hirtigluma subsp. patula]
MAPASRALHLARLRPLLPAAAYCSAVRPLAAAGSHLPARPWLPLAVALRPAATKGFATVRDDTPFWLRGKPSYSSDRLPKATTIAVDDTDDSDSDSDETTSDDESDFDAKQMVTSDSNDDPMITSEDSESDTEGTTSSNDCEVDRTNCSDFEVPKETKNSGDPLSSFATQPATSSPRDSSANWINLPPKDMTLLNGCDFEHWLVVMEPPPGDPSNPDIARDEIIDSYIKTLAQVVGSEEEARQKIYSVSTRHYFAFGALVSEELSHKLKVLPKIRYVLPDSYLDAKNKDYGGEPFINGKAVPYDPKYHEERVRNNARAMERSRNFERMENMWHLQHAPENQRFNNPPPPVPSPPLPCDAPPVHNARHNTPPPPDDAGAPPSHQPRAPNPRAFYYARPVGYRDGSHGDESDDQGKSCNMHGDHRGHAHHTGNNFPGCQGGCSCYPGCNTPCDQGGPSGYRGGHQDHRKSHGENMRRDPGQPPLPACQGESAGGCQGKIVVHHYWHIHHHYH